MFIEGKKIATAINKGVKHMGKYDGWSKEDLAWRCCELEQEIEKLQEKNRTMDLKINSLEFRISQELEPRIRAEKRAYDSWVTNPAR